VKGVVQRNGAGRTGPPEARADDLVIETIQAHAPSLLATARRHSLCADDAHDAYQRALEIFIRRAADLEPDGVVGWLHTVVKHEAMAVRRSRQRLVAAEEIDLDAHESGVAGGEERAVRFELVARAAEALQRLKPQELRALWLKAEGHSYQEIASITGWTYTKVNRCLTEGRRSFLARYADIERGEECERWAPVISAMVDGEATAVELAELRPHLRRCVGCQATVRELHSSVASVAAVLPFPAALLVDRPEAHIPRLLTRLYEAIAGGVHERVAGSAVKVQAALDAAGSGKVAAVAASAAAVAGGGLTAVEHIGDRSRPHTHVSTASRYRHGHAGAATVAVTSPQPAASNPLAPPATSSHRAARAESASEIAASEFGFEDSGSTEAASTRDSQPSPRPAASAASAAAAEFGG
jgi:RNA polymerase sigma factor (sigma-70 family)